MTDRQAKILAAIVEAYAKSAEPIGSLALADAFDVSPATVRAEMAELERLGFIIQPHISAGRVPTDKGYRAYVNALGDAQTDSRVSQAIARRVSSAGEVDRAVKQAASSLAEVTHNLGFATLSNQLFFTGIANLLGQPEFFGREEAYEAARLLDNLEEWASEAAAQGDRVSVLIGHENPIGKNSGCSIIIGRFASPYSDASYVGLLGPTRQNYSQAIGLIDYTSRMLEEVLA